MMIVKRSEQQVSTDLGGEAVILSLERGEYFTLNEVGARLWSALEHPRTIRELVAFLSTSYDLEAASAESDLRAFLSELRSAGLIEFQASQ